MTGKSLDFSFRIILVHLKPRVSDIGVWYHGLEPVDGSRFKQRQIQERLSESNYNFWDMFNLDPKKNWQVVGKAAFHSYHDHLTGEYDDSLEIYSFKKVEVPDSFFLCDSDVVPLT